MRVSLRLGEYLTLQYTFQSACRHALHPKACNIHGWMDGWMDPVSFTMNIWHCNHWFCFTQIFLPMIFSNAPYVNLYSWLPLTSQNIFLLLFSLIHRFTINYLMIKFESLLREYESHCENSTPLSFLWITIQSKNGKTKIYANYFLKENTSRYPCFEGPLGCLFDELPSFQFSFS